MTKRMRLMPGASLLLALASNDLLRVNGPPTPTQASTKHSVSDTANCSRWLPPGKKPRNPRRPRRAR